MRLVLPYPVSANRYWAHGVVGRRGDRGHAVTFVTADAKRYRRQVKIAVVDQGLRRPFAHRVRVDLFLYPHRPLDWERRARRDPLNWDDDVQCINLDNAWKVLMDALNGAVFVDDRWLWEQGGKRMEPDDRGARVELEVAPVARETVQPKLFEAA